MPTPHTLKVGLVQQTCSANVEANKQKLAHNIAEVAARGAELVVLQELHNSLYFCQVESTDNFDLAEPIPGPSTDFYGNLAREHGIVLVPEDRKLQGILANLSISDNINISLLDKNSNRFGFVSRKKEEKVAGDGIRNFKIKTPSPDKKIVELSGGNQQKCIVARWISTNPKVLILDEPTKGIDVGAKSEFYQMICEFAKQGLGVILISSELPEVIGLSDRIIVMKGRKIVGEVSREEATESRLLSLGMIGEVQES